MTERLRVAIIGCGRISNAHAQAVMASPMAELTALVDPVAERAHALAERVGARPVIATDIQTISAHADAAVIATPNHTHREAATQCLHAGLHTLIEKPLAVSASEGERIVEASREANRVVAVGYATRFRENIRLMGDLLRQNYFGRVRRFAYQFGSRGGWAPLSGYNLDRRMTGGGVLVVTGTHFIDRMIDWFGYPESAALADDSRGGPEATAFATFRFRSESQDRLVGMARFSKAVALEGGFVADTEAGTVVLRDRPDASIVLRPHASPLLEHIVQRRSTDLRPAAATEIGRQLENFIESCRSGLPPLVGGAEGLQSLRLLEELYANRSQLDRDWYSSSVPKVGAP